MKSPSKARLPDVGDVYQNAPCGLVSFYMNGAIIKANHTLLKWLDITEKAAGQLSFTDLLDKGAQFYYQLFVQPMLTMHQEVKEINIPLKTPSGSIPCLLNASVFATGDGAVKVVHAAIFKMGERKKYEVELLNKKAQAEKEKQQKTEALEEVAFDQSHLVRLPLANLLGLISLIEKDKLDGETKRLFSLMEQSAAQLDAEIKKIVDKTVG
jgi:sigma-B regulation protein RsbU (phosphoserine phosphatase)